MYLEYDWCFGVYRPRFGRVFIDVRGERSWPSKRDAKDVLTAIGLRIGRKTDTHTWEIVAE